MRQVDLPAKNEMRAAVENMRRHMPEILEYARLHAKLRKAHYDALVSEGFTDQQAIELCKAVQP